MKASLVLWAVISFAVMMPAQSFQKDYLLLDNGDKILVNFPAGSQGYIQIKSLSERARVDIENSAKRGFDMMVLSNKDGWKTYAGKVDGAHIAVTLREVQGNKKDQASADLPWDSDVVVRIVNSAMPRVAGGDNSKRGTRCPVCNAKLEW
jgi:hypothetical protein